MATKYKYGDGTFGSTAQQQDAFGRYMFGLSNRGTPVDDAGQSAGPVATPTGQTMPLTGFDNGGASWGGGSGAAGPGGLPSAGNTGGSGGSGGGSTGPSWSTGANGMPTFNLGSIATQGPSSWNVDKNQTVAGQLSSLLASDSPLMQQARTRAMQQAQSRGLLNSSIAASAGEAAMYDAAMPIATADAQTYGDSARFNADSRNTFSREANAFARDAGMANFNLGANDWAAERALGREQGAADAALRRELELNEATQRQRYESEAAAAAQEETYAKDRAYINALNSARADYAEALERVSTSTNMEEDVKAETLRNLQATFNTVIRGYAQKLGWDPQSWLIETEAAAPPPAPAPAPAPGTGPNFGGTTWYGGDSP